MRAPMARQSDRVGALSCGSVEIAASISEIVSPSFWAMSANDRRRMSERANRR